MAHYAFINENNIVTEVITGVDEDKTDDLPDGFDSWGFFDFLLDRANVVGTPGSGFGAAGEGYFRLSAFNSKENVEKAMQRIVELK